MSRTLAAFVGGAAGVVALVGILIIFIWFCLLRDRSISRTSETNSSDPSLQGRNTVIESSLAGGISIPSDSRDARRFVMEELGLATKDFNEINLIGEGKFGKVYKGLLQDGMIVAIKKRHGIPSHEFIQEVRYLSSVRHRHLVSLLGYCQENNHQMLIYEYIPNGSVSSHLYGVGQITNGKLEFKLRLQIAQGAAKGLEHLHALNPPLLHKDFKTTNVLVDENFVAKVSDAGLVNLLGGTDVAGPSSRIVADDIFLDPEWIMLTWRVDLPWIGFGSKRVKEFGRFSEKSDVYGFGVFLLELVSGREAIELQFSESGQSMVEWARNYQDSSDLASIIDEKLGSSFTAEGMKELIRLAVWCVQPFRESRPTMNYVVSELDRIYDKEMNLTTVMGEEGTPNVILGSQLFTTSR